MLAARLNAPPTPRIVTSGRRSATPSALSITAREMAMKWVVGIACALSHDPSEDSSMGKVSPVRKKEKQRGRCF